MRGVVIALGVAVLAAGCSRGLDDATLADGGAFVLPDSGYIYDGGANGPADADAGFGDTGPHVCNPACDMAEVCGCTSDGVTTSCGCFFPGNYAASCDPQVAESCAWPYVCTRGRSSAGTRFTCSDGRVGSLCSPQEPSCNTSGGCACLSTPFGVSCTCQGDPGPSPLLCDPNNADACPDRTCVRVEAQNGAFYICSDGAEHEPCQPGDGSCKTSLGCTCPIVGGRRICRCSEPGTVEGYACEPGLAESCVAPLECEIRGDPLLGGYVSECAGGEPPPGMEDPFACDPAAPLCPPGFTCDEIRPGVFRCRGG